MLSLERQEELLRQSWLTSYPESPTSFTVKYSTGMVAHVTMIPIGRSWNLFGINRYEFQCAASGDDMLMVLTLYKLGLEEWLDDIAKGQAKPVEGVLTGG